MGSCPGRGGFPEGCVWEQLACGGRIGGIALLMGAMAVSVAHGLVLLELVRGKDRRELALCVLLDGLKLLATLVAGEAGIGTERSHLLLLGRENRLELRGLVVAQLKALAKMESGLVGIEVMVTTMMRTCRLLLRRCGIVCRLLGRLLAEGRSRGKSDRQGRTE